MKTLNVKVKVPYGYYHVGNEFEEIKFEVEDSVVEVVASLLSENKELTEKIVPGLEKEHIELSGLHDMIIQRGFDYFMNWKLSFGIEYAKRDEMLRFYIDDDTKAGLFTPSSKFNAEDEYVQWILEQPYEFSCRKFDIDLTECEKEKNNICYMIEKS